MTYVPHTPPYSGFSLLVQVNFMYHEEEEKGRRKTSGKNALAFCRHYRWRQPPPLSMPKR